VVSLSGRGSVPPPSLLAGLVRQQVVVTLADESGARGVLWAADESGLMLVGAAGDPVSYMPAGADEWSPADGAVFVPVSMLKFVQLPGGVQV
jgi:hypothetical protein